MKDDKMHLINKIFNNETIRTVWDKEQEENEASEKIGQLKLKSQGSKYRLTDVVDIEGIFRIIESIPSKNV